MPDGASTPPFSSRARPGSSRAAGLDATSVAQACGKIFVSPQSGDAEFRSDGSTSLELADGTVRVSFGPLADRADGSYLYVELPSTTRPRHSTKTRPSSHAPSRARAKKQTKENAGATARSRGAISTPTGVRLPSGFLRPNNSREGPHNL